MYIIFDTLKSIFQYRRTNFLFYFILFIFMVLVSRLTYLYIVLSDQLILEGNMRSLRIQSEPMVRGIITDRLGKLLAISIPAYAIWIDPQEIIKSGGIQAHFCDWLKLSDILSISLDKISFIIHSRNSDRFFYLARQLDPMIFNYFNTLKLPGVYVKQELKRFYPAENITAHLVGITNIDHQGIEGIEKSFDSWLTGRSSTRIVRKDRCGQVIEDIPVIHSQSSKNIILSIDERLQRLAYQELNYAVDFHKAESGSIVLIDIDTGEILVMVNVPSYNPNDLSVVNTSVMRNRAITDVFEPGSTVKPIVIMAALQCKVIKKDAILNTLPYMVNGFKIKDVTSYNTLTVQEVLKKSSNVGVSKLALSMPASVLSDLYLKFGMGKSTNIGLIGESSGIYPYSCHWSDIERVTFSYGYGLMITPLQLAKVYATIGGMGMSKPLSILRIDNPVLGHQVFPQFLVRTVLDMMEIKSSLHGGYQDFIKGYRVAIKTGTVKKVGSCGKYIDRYIAYIAGVAPVSNPRFALVVMINDPKNGCYYGGAVSAPVFKVVMARALKIMNIFPDA